MDRVGLPHSTGYIPSIYISSMPSRNHMLVRAFGVDGDDRGATKDFDSNTYLEPHSELDSSPDGVFYGK